MDILSLIAAAESGQVEEYCRAQARAVYTGDHRVLCRVLGKYLMVIDGRDNSVGPHLCMDGNWEWPTTRAIARHLKPGMRCVDVGANFGYFTLLMGHLVGPEGTVQALEPNDTIRTCLRRTVSLNGLGTSVVVWPSACSDVAVPRFAHGVKQPEGGEFAWLTVPPEDWGSAYLVRGNQGHGAQPVDVVRLDALPGVVPPDFVKIDAEGAEPEVWAGMAGHIAQNRAQMAVCLEWAPWRYSDPGAFLDRISADGFRLRRVRPDGRLDPVSDRAALLGAEQGFEMLWADAAES